MTDMPTPQDHREAAEKAVAEADRAQRVVDEQNALLRAIAHALLAMLPPAPPTTRLLPERDAMRFGEDL